MGKTSPITYCSINHANFESLLRHILLVKHYRWQISRFKVQSHRSDYCPSEWKSSSLLPHELEMLPDTTWRLQILDVCLNLALFDLSASSKSTLQVRASPGNISSVEHILYGEGEDRRQQDGSRSLAIVVFCVLATLAPLVTVKTGIDQPVAVMWHSGCLNTHTLQQHTH